MEMRVIRYRALLIASIGLGSSSLPYWRRNNRRIYTSGLWTAAKVSKMRGLIHVNLHGTDHAARRILRKQSNAPTGGANACGRRQ